MRDQGGAGDFGRYRRVVQGLRLLRDRLQARRTIIQVRRRRLEDRFQTGREDGKSGQAWREARGEVDGEARRKAEEKAGSRVLIGGAERLRDALAQVARDLGAPDVEIT